MAKITQNVRKQVLAEQFETDRRGGAALRAQILQNAADAEEKHAAESAREKRRDAREALDPAIAKLAAVRDLLRKMESGDDAGFPVEAVATFARAALCEAATELEQALADLDLLELDRQIGGWFVQEARHGRD